MMVALSSQFGRPPTGNDFEESTEDSSTANDNRDCGTESGNPSADEEKTAGNRKWSPPQMTNPEYESVLQSRSNGRATQDFVERNKNRIVSHATAKRAAAVCCDGSDSKSDGPHNYSIQTLNSTEQAIAKMKSILSKDANSRYTYCQEYAAATVALERPAATQSVSQDKLKWMTKDGFVYPGITSSVVSNGNGKQPDRARIDELNLPWRENILHANILRPTVNRPEFKWKHRHIDFDTHSKLTQEKCPVTLHLAGSQLAAEQLEAHSQDQRKWEEKVVVDSKDFFVHRCSRRMELCERGPHSASQICRQRDILKDEPKKYSLSAPGMLLERIPALGVTDEGNTDRAQTSDTFAYSTYDQGENVSGYNPGPLSQRSLKLFNNMIPVNSGRN